MAKVVELTSRQLNPSKRPGLSLKYAYRPQTNQERNLVHTTHPCLACGRKGHIINGDCGPERKKGDIIYFRVALICDCSYMNFVNVIVNELPEYAKRAKHPITDDLFDSLPDWRIEELLQLSAASGHLGNFAMARKLIDRCIQIAPDSQGAWYNLGWLHVNDGDYQQAIEAYKRVLELGSDFPSALFNLGNIYKDLQWYNEACDAFNKFLKLYPKHIQAKKSLKECEAKV
ncbi:tetratricopeptide repeat protein [Spartinivicinus poritis]|uniref:Tetratricopeptide repeat protein n=1 Tax=Spartinivicinus poritis TaxID=2994640 RepID=A0ABT5U8M0_9GAMM|nr:tetratricopeptide repeat protein [Spartinivicinus sp. A2-2]MDE1462726.1 tetratricopeptide repeat protein [Spartinivicinus sp. A2-2]